MTVRVELDDPYAPFLGPNQYVHYTQDTEAVKTSYALCEGMTDDREIFETIRGYIKANYMYDYVKAATVAGGTLPDIDGCYEKENGESVRIWRRWRPACCACRACRRS